VNWSNIRQKKLNVIRNSCKIDVNAADNQNIPAFIFHYPAETIFPSKLCYTTDVVGGFSVQNICKAPMKMKAAKFRFFAALTFISLIFLYEIICQICGLLRQAKRSKKFPIFSTVDSALKQEIGNHNVVYFHRLATRISILQCKMFIRLGGILILLFPSFIESKKKSEKADSLYNWILFDFRNSSNYILLV
jgi:hypothetical protein